MSRVTQHPQMNLNIVMYHRHFLQLFCDSASVS